MKTPKDWSQVTIAQYYNLVEAIDMDWNDDTERAVAMLSALSSISIKQLMEEVPAKALIKAIAEIKFIGDDRIKGVFPRPSLRVKGRRFEVDLLIRESSASSFISLTEVAKTQEIAKVNIHNVMAVFCYEVNWFGFRKKRTASSQKEIAEFLKNNLTMDKAFVYSGFFLRSWKALSKAMLSYSESQIRKAMKIVKKEAQSL